MGIFRQFPYTNFHDMNLDWIIHKVNDMIAEIFNINKKVDDFIIETEPTIRDEVDNWLNDHPEATTTVEDHSIGEIKLTEELANKTIKDYYTPQMFGAAGDGVTDDTEAFKELIDKYPVVIPDGNYVISEIVTLDHAVIKDFGTYIDYMPLYPKQIDINFGDMVYDNTVQLPAAKSYAEAAVAINNYYYVAVRDVTDEPNVYRGVIIQYDMNFNQIKSHVISSIASAINSMHTDGEYLYVDWDNKTHTRIDLELTTDIHTQSEFRNLIPYNKTWYGVDFDNEGVIISELNGYAGGVVNTHKVYTSQETLQSTSIINGIMFIPTTYGRIRIIDLANYALTEVPYNEIKEIESVFYDFNTESIKVVGHVYGLNGIFNIGIFQGADYTTLQYIPADASQGYTNLIAAISQDGLFKISNGTSSVYPVDDLDLLALQNIKLMGSLENHKIMSVDGGLINVIGSTSAMRAPITVNISGNQLTGYIELMGAAGYIHLIAASSAVWSQFTNGDVIGTLPALYRPTREVFVTGYARSGGAAESDLVPCYLSIQPNGNIALNGKNTLMRSQKIIQICGSYPLDSRRTAS